MNALSKRNFVVYRIKNMINGRVYFGSTNNFNNRMAQHLKVMRGQGSGLPNYLRDIQRLGHKPEDFSFRVIARFDNQVDMLECEQKFLDMYWGTKSCYNTSHEVQDNWVKTTLVVWNMKTLEVRQYLSCHAIRKDLGISKQRIANILDGKILHSNYWVVEPWSKRQTVAEVVKFYKRCKVALPKHALNPRKKVGLTPIPGTCSISELVYRRRYKVVSPYTYIARNRLLPNHQEQFWYQ